MNEYDVKQREEVGFNDMDKYPFGGLEVDKLLTNGYQLYIPYGIHCDIFKAIEAGVKTLGEKREKLQNTIDNLENDETNKEANNALIQNLKYQVKDYDKNIKILQTILPIINEI